MAVINTNVKALYTQHALKGSARAQTVAMEQLSTGKRINSARDDAAGMAIAKRMSQQIRSLDMAIRNAGDAVALIQTAEGATGTITDMLQRMRELAIQAMNDTNAQDQRGYLDLEFQQLKQQIVTISEHTQWNGFSILNGSVGERVGERPVYRVTSQPAFYDSPNQVLTGIQGGDLIINGTTIRKAEPLDGAIDGVEPKPLASAQGSAIAIAKAINASTNDTKVAAVINTNVMQGTAMDGSAKSGFIVINGIRTGDITTTLNNARVSRENIVKAINDISSSTGVMAVDTGSERLGIRLEAKDGRNIAVEMKPAGSTSVADFSAATGIRQGLQVGTYSLETTVEGPLDIASTGDWTRVGIPPATSKDSFNYGQNLSIAQSSLRSVIGPNPPTLTGFNLSESIVGTIVAANPTAQTPVKSSATFAATENKISSGDKISFKYDGISYTATIAGTDASAVNTALAAAVSDVNGVQLGAGKLTASIASSALKIEVTAADKNITEATYINADNVVVTSTPATATEGAKLTIPGVVGSTLVTGFKFNLSYKGQTFTATIGGNITASSSVADKLAAVQDAVNTSLSGALPLGAGKISATFANSNADLVLQAGLVGDSPSALQQGDLVINGVEIRGTLDSDDKSTYGNTLGSNRLGSAIAIAAAINASSEETGVRAVANPVTISGQSIEKTGLASGTIYSLFINGTEISVKYEGEGNVSWLNKIATEINSQAAHIQVSASAGKTGLNLTAKDGRNLSVWFNSSQVTAQQLGLANSSGTSTVAGVAGAPGVTKDWTDAPTVYGTVSLFSDKSFTVEPGFNGYTAASNFTKLGFNEGTFGGTVNEAESKMTPPRTGRLTFHVGASATQTIHIDFADYGAKGPITGDITGDVEFWNSEKRVNRIDNAESARAVLAKLDTALDKVNGNRAVMGAMMNRLDYIMENLSNVSMNTSASRSQIEDADYAKASTELARTQIMQQAATAVLAQANMDQQTVLKLLQ